MYIIFLFEIEIKISLVNGISKKEDETEMM
jgi:hypothetical protein